MKDEQEEEVADAVTGEKKSIQKTLLFLALVTLKIWLPTRRGIQWSAKSVLMNYRNLFGRVVAVRLQSQLIGLVYLALPDRQLTSTNAQPKEDPQPQMQESGSFLLSQNGYSVHGFIVKYNLQKREYRILTIKKKQRDRKSEVSRTRYRNKQKKKERYI